MKGTGKVAAESPGGPLAIEEPVCFSRRRRLAAQLQPGRLHVDIKVPADPGALQSAIHQTRYRL